AVPRAECFPIERLAAENRPLAEEMLLKMLDSEALYTLVGHIKPMSESFWTARLPMDGSDVSRLESARAALKAIRCGNEFHADVLVFAQPSRKQLVCHAFVCHVPSVVQAVKQHRQLFGKLGITLNSHPMEIMLTTDRA